jgi:hypothetical protein
MNGKDPQPNEAENTARRTTTTGPPPDEYANPPGVGGEDCDIEAADAEAEPCDPTRAEDLVLEESRPGFGISGYEGEEVGGG